MAQIGNTYGQREGIRELTNEEIAEVAGGSAQFRIPLPLLSFIRSIESFFSSLFHRNM